MPVGRFLAGIGALIWDPETDRFLLLRRAADKDFGAGTWECPTGRLDQGEGFSDALHREVMEELGVKIRLEFPVCATHFFRGSARPENELVGLIFCCSILPGSELQPGSEHDAWKWMSAAEIDVFLTRDHWLRPVIDRARFLLAQLSAAVREHFHQAGFDL